MRSGSAPATDCVILHNPHCSKSRAALALLRERGLEPRIVEYLREPPSAAEFERLLQRLGLEPRQALRREEPEYAALGLDDPALDRAELVSAAVAHPRLIQRPIVVVGERAAIGRPPEAILALL